MGYRYQHHHHHHHHPPTRTDKDSGAVESEIREGSQVTKSTPLPPPRTYRDSQAAASGVGGEQGGRTHTYRLMGSAQDAVLEEAATLVKDRTLLTAEAKIGRRRKKRIDCGDAG